VFRLRYLSPACGNVGGCIDIGVSHKATRCTDKLERLTMPTRPTTMTGLGGVGRIDEHDRHTSILRFVRHKLPQLVERPTVVLVALELADLGPLSHAGQVFQRNLSVRGLCRLDKRFADLMVDMAHMAVLSSRQPFQKPFGSQGAFPLESLPDFGIVRPNPLDFEGLIHRGVRIHCHTALSQINPKGASGYLRRRSSPFALHMQEKGAIAALDQRRTRWRLPCKTPCLVGAKRCLKPLTGMQQGQTEGPVPFPQTCCTVTLFDEWI
jgi:hypothetical protein